MVRKAEEELSKKEKMRREMVGWDIYVHTLIHSMYIP